MFRRIHLLLVLICLATLATAQARPLSREHAMAAASAAAVATTTDLTPLPGSCGDGLPSNENLQSVCCMFGYVVIDGQAVAGAKVTITDSTTGKVAEEWTEYGPNSSQPYYSLSLSDRLNAQVGDTITIKAEYSAHSQTAMHNALAGGQQVDVVLPRNQDDDYVYERQIWQQGDPGTFQFPQDVAVDGAGNVYVVDAANARIQVFNRSGQYLRQWGSLGNARGQFFQLSRIAVDQLGNVYVSETGNHRVQKFTNTGTWIATWGDPNQNLGNGPGQFDRPADLAIDSNGNLYVADRGNNRIQKLSSAGAWTTLGNGVGAGDGQFKEPFGVAVDGVGNVYVADSGNYRVQKFDSNGSFVRKWGNKGSANDQFNTAVGIATDRSGNVYVVDSGYVYVNAAGNQRIQKFDSNGTYLTTLGGPGEGDGQFAILEGVAIDNDNNVYVADTYHNQIQKLTDTGTFLTKWGTPSTGIGQFFGPLGAAMDRNGNLFVADTGTSRIQKLNAQGVWQQPWGPEIAGNGSFGAVGGIAVDTDGSVYVADRATNHIPMRKFTNAGAFITKWGNPIPSTLDGQFNGPFGVATDGNGDVYVADEGNHRIQKFTSAGAHLATWGGPISGTLDGQFNKPEGVAVDGNGNVYVADTYNYRIQKFNSAGSWLATITQWTIPGGGTEQVVFPGGVAVDRNNNVYFTDASHRIVKLSSTGGGLSTWSMYGAGAGQVSGPQTLFIDPNGLVYVVDTGNNRIEVFRPMTDTRPVATIVQATPRGVAAGQSVELHGRGGVSVSSGVIAGYEWTLDGSATPFATGADATSPNLAPGAHTVSFRVRDSNGTYSDAQNVDIVASDPSQPSETWTFLLYMDGDNNLAPFLNLDSQLGALYRLKNGLPNANVRVVAFYDGSRSGGDSFRYTVGPTGAFTQEALGEANMGNPQTLIDFVRWGKQQALADHYYLAIADHANALDGIAWDYTTAPIDHLTNSELRQALVTITENGAHPLDVLHLDGCLMGLLENTYQVRGMAKYLISSENLAWSAFAYDVYRQTIGAHTDARALATAIVDSYAAVVGGQAKPYTIAALDLSKVDDVAVKTSALAQELLRYALDTQTGEINRDTLVSLRTQAQKLDSGGNIAITDEDEYVDLADWLTLLSNGVSDSTIVSRATVLLNALPGLVIHEHHASGKVGTIALNLDRVHGLAIYYPPRASAKTYQNYAQGDLSFPIDTLWDEFLAAGLAALPFDPNPPEPNPVPPLPLAQPVFLPMIIR